ncbi:MAG: hypothetical protein H8D22_09140 [Candidatus Cloacimonetes bacterium]|nr:hypothetical protein [Candidatus Cloacimonadota bacterium]
MKKYISVLIFFIVFLILSSCTVKKFEAPEWDVQFEIPVINERYYMSDLEDSTDTYIISLQNDTLYFSASKEIETKNVGDELKVDGQSESFDEEIGDELKIDSREESFSVKVGDRLSINGQNCYFERTLDKIEIEETGEANAVVGVLDFARSVIPGAGNIYNEVIPPIYNYPPIDTNFTVFENDNIEYVIIDSGFAYIEFFNDTDIPLSSTEPSHYMEIEIYGEYPYPQGELILTHSIDHIIHPRTSENISIDLAGSKVYRYNFLRIQLTTDGSDGAIDVLESDKFEVTLSMSEMLVNEASAILPPEYIDHREAISIEDNTEEIEVVSAKIDSCIGNIHIENYLPVDGTVTIQFDELIDNFGDQYEISFYVTHDPPENDYPLNLSGFEISSTKQEVLDSLHFRYFVQTDSTTDYVTILYDDYVSTDITFGEIVFEEVTGYITQTFNQDDSLSIADESDKILLQEAEIKSGIVSIDLSGLDYEPEISIIFDELRDQNNNPVELTNDDFSGYDFAGNKILVWEDQMVHYHVTVDFPQGQLITVSSSDSVYADIHIGQLIFESVTGKFGSFTIDDTDAIEVDSTGEFNLYYAEIDSCDVSIQIKEEDYSLPFEADIEIVFEEIYDSNGDTLIINLHCPGDTTLSFAGHTIGDAPSSTTSIDSLHYSFEVITDSTDNYVTVNYYDEVKATIDISDMIFNQVKGIINNKRFDMEDIEEEIDITDVPDSLDDVIDFQNAELHLDVYNGTGFNCWLNIQLVGKNDSGDSAEVIIDNSTGVLHAHTTSHLIVTEGVSEFLSLIPTMITAKEPYAIIGDGTTPGTITKEDSITGSYSLETPFKFIINDHTVRMDTLQHIELDEEARDAVEKNLNSVKMFFTLDNLLPFGSNVKLYFASDSTQVWDNPELIIDSLIVEPAIIDTVHQVSGEATTSQVNIELTDEEHQFDVFTNPDVYIGVKIGVIGTNGETVILRGSDNLRVFGHLKVNAHIDDSLWEE